MFFTVGVTLWVPEEAKRLHLIEYRVNTNEIRSIQTKVSIETDLLNHKRVEAQLTGYVRDSNNKTRKGVLRDADHN